MTVLGKMMVFLVMLLSFVWCGLVVNTFVTRTNWKNEADYYKAQAEESAKAAEAMKQQLIAQRNAHTSESQALVAANTQQQQLIQENSDRSTALKTNYDKVLNDFTEQSAQTITWKANIDLLQTQVTSLTEAVEADKRQIDQLVLDANNARIAKEQANLDATANKQRADQATERALVLQGELTDLKSGNSGSALSAQAPDPLPQNWNGTVQKFYPNGDYVELTPGLDSQLDVGHSLIVSRGSQYIGTVTVTNADPKTAIGSFRPANPQVRATAENRPKPGDVLRANK